jgi:hypothetical protein
VVRRKKSEPLDPGTGGPLDQNSVVISYIRSSGVRRLEGVTFDRRSREVPRVEARENTWHIHQVGLARLTGGHALPQKGVNTLLTSRVSEIREIRARRLNAPTREVVSCEKCKEEVNHC